MTSGNEFLFTGRELKVFFSWLLYSCTLACKSELPEGKQAACSNSGGLSAAGSVGAALILANYILTFPLSSNPPHGCLESITSMSGCGLQWPFGLKHRLVSKRSLSVHEDVKTSPLFFVQRSCVSMRRRRVVNVPR